MTKAIYDAVGLTPYRALFLHLLLIGYPLRFGLFATGYGNKLLSIPETIIPAPCRIFHAARECSDTEEIVIRDFGARFISQYSLAWFVCIIMRTSTANTVAYHRILLALSISQLLIMTWLQTFFHPTPTQQEFDPDFFTNMVFYTVMATVVSLWTVATQPYIPVGSMKWSIPANALFCGGVSGFIRPYPLMHLLETFLTFLLSCYHSHHFSRCSMFFSLPHHFKFCCAAMPNLTGTKRPLRSPPFASLLRRRRLRSCQFCC